MFQGEGGFKAITFPVGPLGCNCSIVWDPATKEALLIDPGAEPEKISKKARELGLKPSRILHTHAHFDHIGASDWACEHFEASLYLHPEDRPLWDNLPLQGKSFGMEFSNLKSDPAALEDEQTFQLGGFTLKTLYTPGHTPGSCSFIVGNLLFAGDTLFKGSIGRTDLWGGDFNLISQSIKERLYALDGDTHVITGHGPSTSIGVERKHNAFVRA